MVVIKGDVRAPALVGHPSSIDVGPHGKRLRFGVKVWPVNGSMIKEELYRWLRLERPTEESGNPYPLPLHWFGMSIGRDKIVFDLGESRAENTIRLSSVQSAGT